MEHNYTLNPSIEILLDMIENGSKEKEVQALVENVLWTVYPAVDYWLNLTKYQQGATEPDDIVRKLISYTGGWAPIDVMMVELKRIKEDTSMKAFNSVADSLLDDHMAESTNPEGSTLFGMVGIGKHVVFYERVLPRHKLKLLVDRPLHWWDDYLTIQYWFNYTKEHVTKIPATAPTGPSLMTPAGPSLGTYPASYSAGPVRGGFDYTVTYPVRKASSGHGDDTQGEAEDEVEEHYPDLPYDAIHVEVTVETMQSGDLFHFYYGDRHYGKTEAEWVQREYKVDGKSCEYYLYTGRSTGKTFWTESLRDLAPYEPRKETRKETRKGKEKRHHG